MPVLSDILSGWECRAALLSIPSLIIYLTPDLPILQPWLPWHHNIATIIGAKPSQALRIYRVRIKIIIERYSHRVYRLSRQKYWTTINNSALRGHATHLLLMLKDSACGILTNTGWTSACNTAWVKHGEALQAEAHLY